MTRTQLKKHISQPNPPTLKTDPIRQVELNQIGFGVLVAYPYNNNPLTIILVFKISSKAQFVNPFFTETDLSKLRLAYQICWTGPDLSD